MLPKRTVLTITSIGDPNKITSSIMPSLYGTAYGTKFKVFSGKAGSGSAGKPKKKDMKIGHCSAFWPDAHLKPKSKWTGIWNLEIPLFVKAKDLVQKNPKLPVKLTTLPAGLYAQILHIGTYAGEEPTIKRLHAYMKNEKLKIIGAHEEVYLTRPGPKAKTIIRYQVTLTRKK